MLFSLCLVLFCNTSLILKYRDHNLWTSALKTPIWTILLSFADFISSFVINSGDEEANKYVFHVLLFPSFRVKSV